MARRTGRSGPTRPIPRRPPDHPGCRDTLSTEAVGAGLLGWEIDSSDDTWVTTVSPPGSTKLSFQHEPNYRPPTWPSETDKQQMMLHLDFQVEDLEAAHEHAVEVGARLMEWQPQPDVRVYADPVGHVLCFFT